jgi:predicted phosphodiesterase
MKFVFVTDLHLYAPHAIEAPGFWDEDPSHYSLGDMFDLKCQKRRTPQSEGMTRMRALHRFLQLYKGRFVRGNHELNRIDGPDELVVEGDTGRIVLTHGDLLFWGKGRSFLYRSQKPGANVWQRLWTGFTCGILARRFGLSVKIDFLERAAEIAQRHQAGTVVCGHWHPPKLLELQHQGVRIFVLPRGKTVLHL